MEQNAINYELVARMLTEFVISLNQEWVNPDICKKGAVAIETLLSENQRLKSLLVGKCRACQLTVPCPIPSEPLSLEDLRGMAGKPYWHVGLRPESEPSHWAILPNNVAQNPQDYHYGEYWLAYCCEIDDIDPSQKQ